MAERCEYIEGCPMYKHFKLEASKKIVVTTYCEGNFEKCEGRKLRKAGKFVPEKLLPDGRYLP